MQNPQAAFGRLNRQLEQAVAKSAELQENWETLALQAEEIRIALQDEA